MYKRYCKLAISDLKRIKEKRLLIYGTGKGGEIFAEYLKEKNIKLSGFIDRNNSGRKKLGYDVLSIESCNIKNDFICICVMDEEVKLEILYECLKKGFSKEDILEIIPADLPEIMEMDHVYRGVKIGKFTYGYKTFLEPWMSNIMVESIGKYCSINSSARVWCKHVMGGVSTYPFITEPFEHTKGIIDIMENNTDLCGEGKIIIGNDVWIGANAVVLPNVRIADGSIIGAGAVVTKDVKPYQIVGGVPAKHIRFRYDSETIKKLLRITWWNWENDEVKKRLDDFNDIKLFIRKYGKELF